MEGYLRKADEKDVELLFSWVNDPITRKSAFDSHVISYDEHVNWFQKILKTENIHQLIFEKEGVPVGQVRIEKKGDAAELDYSIAPGFRMMGYGKELIALVKQYVETNFRDVKEIVAFVKAENIGSQKMLLENDFSPQYGVYSYTLGKESNEVQKNSGNL